MFKKITPKSEWLVFDDNPIMKQKVEEVRLPLNDEDKDVISKMISYIDASYDGEFNKYKIRPGIGIAAIQLGYPKQIIYIHLDQDETEHKYLLANPKIIKQSLNKAFLPSGEGCLSVDRDVKGLSIRNEIVVVEAIDLFTNENITIRATGLLSMCLQHEIDHNNNIFYYDRINKEKPFYKDKNWKEVDR
ncbi:peptide deformylase [Malacoplasma iowae]|uniref:Peptide deformylase n=2 Tax=Malacoplasma iowae TaxID=2116 RepID=A0A084U2Y6_MALIO|nr:peptide deformylase [Malacoplasma iowae]KFB07322.1 peptide deformylase [Malacoplasma iowae DK-CPA]WPL36908.1 peptide deformylase [Malacoplasma iowae]WPL39045.1 peptide deformylase [Malacoplasma iowae]